MYIEDRDEKDDYRPAPMPPMSPFSQGRRDDR